MRLKYLKLFLSSGAVLCVAVFFAAINAFAADQIKTTDHFVAGFDSQISSATSSQFSVYIGDNLSGVTDPIKSVYFTVSGVYTGNGSLELKIDDTATTSKIFTMPAVVAPTPFEIIYKDDSNKINPASAGNYSYTLNIIPTGITISGLGSKITVTDRYAPVSCPDGQTTNEKIKTTDHFVAGFDSQISSATSSQFSVYIGDNLSGVTDPIKSVYFTVSGVYTGNGSLELKIDDTATTSKIFTMPAVVAPTPFEIIYKDDSNKINPASAGNYSYTLNIIPTGITISGLGSKATVSHRYKPPSCGTGYPATGELISPVFDTTGINDGPAYNSIMWKGALGGPSEDQGRVRFQIAASSCANGATDYPACSSGTWSFAGGSTCGGSDWFEPAVQDSPTEIKCYSQFNNKRYFKYKVQICSNDCVTSGDYTPTVNDVVVSWSP